MKEDGGSIIKNTKRQMSVGRFDFIKYLQIQNQKYKLITLIILLIIMKSPPQFDFKTQISQQSNIDIFSKLQVSFLEKFFSYNLTDYFPQRFSNVYEDVIEQKTKNKAEKFISSNLYSVKKDFIVQEIERKIEKFYKTKSKSMQDGQLPFAFKFKYCNLQPMPNLLRSGELIYVDVKIKAEVKLLEQFPEKILKTLSIFRDKNKENLTNFTKLLSNYKGEYFNIFIVYFGDCNFHYFKKDKYQVQTIKLMGATYKLRIFVFFISKQALIESFKTINKIANFEYINDLVIQFYELKRERQKKKKKRELAKIEKEKNAQQMEKIYKIVGIVSLVSLGFLMVKIMI